jgi:hypothetical protein
MEQAGWSGMDQIYREFPLRAGRVVVRGKQANATLAPCCGPTTPCSTRPTSRWPWSRPRTTSTPWAPAWQQAIRYAELLDVPFSFASNGDGFVFRDATWPMACWSKPHPRSVPVPDELWSRYCAWKGWSADVRRVAAADYAPSKTPRYYQLNAINRTVEAIAAGQNRVLLVMATGTGKTYTAFQIIWRLWKSGAKKRILFLADRNILIDQTMVNDFRPFKGAMAKLSPNAKGVERVDAQGRWTVEDARTGRATNHQAGRQELRDLPLALPGRHRHRRRKQHLQAVQPRLLRPHRGRRMPPGQRGRRLRLARHPQLLRQRHADRPDRHAQGNQRRFQHRLLRRARLHLQPASRASKTATWRPTRSSASIWTRTPSAGAPPPA